jgi:hypothetical protein
MIPFDTFTDTQIYSRPTISHGKNFFQKCRFYGNRPCTRSDGNSSAAACLLWPPLLAAACLPARLWDRAGGGGGVEGSLNFVRRTKFQIFWTQEALKITHNTNASSVPHCLVSRATNLENPIVFLIYCILMSRTFVLKQKYSVRPLSVQIFSPPKNSCPIIFPVFQNILPGDRHKRRLKLKTYMYKLRE